MSDWLIVRPAVTADAEALVNLGRSVAAEGELWLTYNRSQSDERRNVKSVRRDPNAAVFVAERNDGAIIGRLSLARDTHPASAHVADLGLMVAKEARRQGAGRTLLQAAVEWARGSGIRKLELHVFPWNQPAIQLYERFGFEREGRRKGHYQRAGNDVDAILMALRIS